MRSVNHSAGRFRKQKASDCDKCRQFPSEFPRSFSLGRPLAVKKEKWMNSEKDREFQIDVITRLTAIETLLKEMDFNEVEKTANKALAESDKNSQDIAELQSYVKWFVMAVLGAIVAAVLSLVLK
jgi:hypothetical protein